MLSEAATAKGAVLPTKGGGEVGGRHRQLGSNSKRRTRSTEYEATRQWRQRGPSVVRSCQQCQGTCTALECRSIDGWRRAGWFGRHGQDRHGSSERRQWRERCVTSPGRPGSPTTTKGQSGARAAGADRSNAIRRGKGLTDCRRGSHRHRQGKGKGACPGSGDRCEAGGCQECGQGSAGRQRGCNCINSDHQGQAWG